MQTPELSNAQKNQSTEKIFRIMEFLAEQAEPCRLMDVATALDMNQSTALRFINTLVKLGYAAQEKSSSKYYLTFKICMLSNKIMRRITLSQIARPYMRELACAVRESACLAIEQQEQVVYIEIAEGPQQVVRAMQRIGNIAPIYCTGIGKLFMLNKSREEIEHIFDTQPIIKFTENTITTKEGIFQELEQIRKNHYACDNEECEPGARCFAVPIYNADGKIVAGLSVTGPTVRLNQDFCEKNISVLQDTAKDISSQLGWTGEI